MRAPALADDPGRCWRRRRHWPPTAAARSSWRAPRGALGEQADIAGGLAGHFLLASHPFGHAGPARSTGAGCSTAARPCASRGRAPPAASSARSRPRTGSPRPASGPSSPSRWAGVRDVPARVRRRVLPEHDLGPARSGRLRVRVVHELRRHRLLVRRGRRESSSPCGRRRDRARPRRALRADGVGALPGRRRPGRRTAACARVPHRGQANVLEFRLGLAFGGDSHPPRH